MKQGSIFIKRLFPFIKNIEENMKEIILGSFSAFSLKIVANILGFVYSILIARFLGPAGAGIYFLSLTIMKVCSMLGLIGMDKVILRIIAIFNDQNELGKVLGVFQKASGIVLFSSLLLMIGVIWGADLIALKIFSDPFLATPIRLMAIAILPFGLLSLTVSLLRGIKKINYSVMLEELGIPLLGIPLLIILGVSFKINGAVIAYVLSVVIVMLVGLIFSVKSVPSNIVEKNTLDSKSLFASGMPLMWISILALLMAWTDTIMIGMWLDSEAVGIYNVCIRTAGITGFILAAVNAVTAPKFASIYAKGDIESLSNIASDVTKIMTIVAIPFFSLFFFFPSWILSLFGEEFVQGSSALVLLSVGQMANVMAGSVGWVLMMCGQEKKLQHIIFFSIVTNIILNYYLIPRWGIVGASIATSTSLIILNVIANITCRMILNVRINIWPPAFKSINR